LDTASRASIEREVAAAHAGLAHLAVVDCDDETATVDTMFYPLPLQDRAAAKVLIRRNPASCLLRYNVKVGDDTVVVL
jgi:hypothetical protein